MNKQLKHITRSIFVMFLSLFLALTLIQVVNADSLRANELNRRSHLNSFQVERGSILVGGNPIAYSVPSDDEYQFLREYPQGAVYAPLTGYFSHYQGSTGIEQALNESLSGNAGNQFFNRVARILSGQDPQGSSVELTIDPAAQTAAYAALGDMKGAVVALDATTGEVLALASTPSYDPNLLASNDNSEIITNYRQLEQDTTKPLINRAIAGDLYHPGSVFKLITVAAALESGDYTASSTFDDPASYTLPGSRSVMQNASRTYCDAGDDDVTLEMALIKSCNIPFAELAAEMDPNALPEMAKQFGFESPLQVPLNVTPSTVGAPVDDAQLGLTAIGQYEVRVTPMQMALVAAAIVNDGTQVKPNLVKDILTPDLRSEYNFTTETLGTPISSSTAATLKQMMVKGVTDPNGLVKRAAVAGVTVGGKTGTAETGLDANGNSLPFNLWFTGFGEKDGRKIAVAVAVEEAGGASANYAGNSYDIPTVIAQQVMEAVLSQ